MKQCIAGKLDWKGRARREARARQAQQDRADDGVHVVDGGGGRAGRPELPGADAGASRTCRKPPRSGRDEALEIEAKYFAKAALTPQANALIGVFLADQAVKKAAGAWEKKSAKEIKQAAVLGAGIMGGGIAYQSAFKGTPIIMKDIRDDALDLGMNEAGKLLSKQVEKGRIDAREDERDARPHPPDAELRRLRRRRHHHRGRRREPEGQEGGVRRGRGPGARRHDHRVEHLDDLDQPTWPRA